MTTEKIRQLIRIIIGIILMFFSLCWTIFHLKLIYDYHFTTKLFMIILPDWILVLNTVAGFAGVVASVLVLKNKINPYLAIAISTIFYLGLGIIVNYLTL